MSLIPIALVLGVGQRNGAAIAAKFKAQGFNVAVASRSLDPKQEEKERGYLGLKIDLKNAEEIVSAFDVVEKKFGGPPSAVIYNAGYKLEAPGGAADPFSTSFQDYADNVNVVGLNAYLVAKLANEGFDRLPADQLKAFIATGNVVPWSTKLLPAFLGLWNGKQILYTVVDAGATAYGPKGNRFYYATEVNEEGKRIYPPDADDHAEVFWKLFNRKEQGNWDIRFVKGGAGWKPEFNP